MPNKLNTKTKQKISKIEHQEKKIRILKIQKKIMKGYVFGENANENNSLKLELKWEQHVRTRNSQVDV